MSDEREYLRAKSQHREVPARAAQLMLSDEDFRQFIEQVVQARKPRDEQRQKRLQELAKKYPPVPREKPAEPLFLFLSWDEFVQSEPEGNWKFERQLGPDDEYWDVLLDGVHPETPIFPHRIVLGLRKAKELFPTQMAERGY